MYNKYGNIYLDNLQSLPEEWWRTDTHGRKYLRVCFGQKKEKDKFGNSHYLRIVVPKQYDKAMKNKMFLSDMRSFMPDDNNELYK